MQPRIFASVLITNTKMDRLEIVKYSHLKTVVEHKGRPVFTIWSGTGRLAPERSAFSSARGAAPAIDHSKSTLPTIKSIYRGKRSTENVMAEFSHDTVSMYHNERPTEMDVRMNTLVLRFVKQNK